MYVHTLKIRDEFAKKGAKDEILENDTNQCEGHAEDAHEQISNCQVQQE